MPVADVLEDQWPRREAVEERFVNRVVLALRVRELASACVPSRAKSFGAGVEERRKSQRETLRQTAYYDHSFTSGAFYRSEVAGTSATVCDCFSDVP